MPIAVKKRIPSGEVGKVNSKRRRKSEEITNEHQHKHIDRSEKDILAKFNITTSELLVKTLKGGTAKIQDKINIANAAWTDTSIPVPRKEHLLAEWMLDVLNKESKSATKSEAYSLPELWKLLQVTLEDLRQRDLLGHLGKYPLISFILSLGNAIYPIKDDKVQSDILHSAVGALQIIPDSFLCSVETLSSALKIWFELINERLCISNNEQFASILAMLLRVWICMSNQKKSKQILFEKDIFASFCAAFSKIEEFPELADSHIRSHLCRLSFDSFSPSGREKVEYQQIIDLLNVTSNAVAVLPTLLKQKCFQINITSSLSEQASERQDIWNQLVIPFLDLLMKEKYSHVNILHSILSTIEEKRLYPLDIDTSKSLLRRTLQYFITALHNGETSPRAFEGIRFIQQIDESIFDDNAWHQALASLATQKPSEESRELLKSICGSFSKLRSLDHFVRLILDGGLKEAYDPKGSSKDVLQKILQGNLFDSKCWSSFLGPSLQNFVSSEQSIIILELITSILSDLRSNSDSSGDEIRNCLIFHFSGRVILYMAMPIPARTEIASSLKRLFEGIVLPAIELSIQKKQAELTTAIIYTIECIVQRLDATSKLDIPVEWTDLIQNIQSSQTKYFLSPKDIILHPPLQIQTLLGVLERCHRDLAKGIETPFFPWLEEFFCSSRFKISTISQDVRTINEILDIGSTALDIVFSSYLPVIEKGGSDKLLETLATFAKEILKKDSRCSVAISLLTNATNLELGRWRKVFDVTERNTKLSKESQDVQLTVSAAKEKLGNSLEEMLKEYEQLYTSEGEEVAQVLYAPVLVQAIRLAPLEEYEKLSQLLLTDNAFPNSFPLMVCNGPEGSLAIARSSLNRLLGNCISSNYKPSDIDIRKLEAIVEGKTILFRSREIGTLLVVFTRAFDKNEGNSKAFSSIVSTLLNFVKLRSEMLDLLLPQISILMGKILAHFKKTSNLNDSQTIRQARLYTRLCTTITSRQANLSKPFGLQALPIILEYIRALTSVDGIGIGETRLELERGMFALCSILANWQRDLLFDMMNDDAERIIARKLWRNFESQKYKGE